MPARLVMKTEEAPRRGAELLLEVLRSEGVEYIFGNPGTTELPLMDALTGVTDIAYVLALQEASAVAMADGYAQASGKVGFLNLHTAGGLGHGMGNLLNAAVSQTPLVVTAGQQDSRHSITDPLLFADLVSVARPAMKWAQEVANPAQLPVLVRRAFNDANAAPSGPVFLSLPMNVLEDLTTVDAGEPSFVERHAVAGSLIALADRLTAITPGKLAIIAGDEIHGSMAAGETVALAEALAASVFGSSWPAHIPFPTAHPLWCGNLTTRATEIAAKLEGFEAVLALGGKSLITILYTEGSALPPHCELYQISSDVRDLGRTYHTGLSAVGDIRASLQALLPLVLERTTPRAAEYAVLVEWAAKTSQQRTAENELEIRELLDRSPILPQVAAHEAVRAIGPKVAIVDESIATANDVRRFLRSWSPTQYSFLRGGALGWGMPAAVGASLGLGRSPVVCLVGDGAAMYSPQAMWTAAHEKLPVTFVVMNNGEYNVLKKFMRSQPQFLSAQTGRFIAMDITQPPVDYQALAASMGLSAQRVLSAREIAPVMEAAIASGRPNLVEIVIAAL